MLLGILLLGTFNLSAQDDRAGKGGRLVIADAASDVSLDPFVTTWHSYPSQALYANLFARDLEGNYIGYLADTWEIAEDGKALTINLIDFATFSDGTPVNAEAIKWNLLRQVDPEVGSTAGAQLIGILKDVEVLSEYSFTIHLEAPYAPLFYLLSWWEIVSPTAYEQWGVSDFGTHPVGSGPFLLKELNTGNYVIFERNPDFRWAPEEVYDNPGPVYLDEFQILFIGEEQTILSALEVGEIQYAVIPSQNVTEFQQNSDIDTMTYMLDQIRYVGFNTSKAPWDNQELRQALAYGVDREEFGILAWDGLAVPLYQPLPPTIWGHNPDLDATSYHYDPEKAQTLLDELGYKDVDGDGNREDPEGNTWTVRLSAATDDIWRRQAEVIAAQWHEIGVNVEIELLEWTSLIELTTTGTHDLFLLLYGYADPSVLTYFFDSNRKGGSNRAWFSADELTTAMIDADSDLNQETRYEKVKGVSQMIIDYSPWIFLVVPENTIGVRNELHNWKFNPVEVRFLFWDAYFEVDN